MAKKYLDENGLLYFWQKIKNTFAKTTDIPTKTSDLTNDSDYVVDVSYTHTDNNYTTTEKNKLSGIASGAEVNVQADWNVTDSASDAYIKNKPTIPSGVSVDTALSSTSENPVQNKVINSALNGKAKGNARIFYGTSETAAETVTKVVTCDDYDTYTEGDVLVVKFDHANTVTNPMIKVNRTLSAAYVRQMKNGELNTLENGGTLREVCIFVYTGVYWVVQGADDNTTYSNATTSDAGLMSATDKGKVDKLVFDSNNIIDSSILPSYVDDVIEAYPLSGATELSSSWLSTSSGGSALTPETGKIYVLMADSTSYAANSQFRWSGTTYVKLSDGGVSEITNSEIDAIVAA